MAAIGSILALLHAWVSTAAAVVAGAVLVLAVVDAAGVARTRTWTDRLALALFACLVGAAILGPGIVVGVGPPSSPLHFVFAAVALGAVPLARTLATRRRATRAGWWVAGGALLTLVALYLLWTSGA